MYYIQYLYRYDHRGTNNLEWLMRQKKRGAVVKNGSQIKRSEQLEILGVKYTNIYGL